jgi:hypothetical protein
MLKHLSKMKCNRCGKPTKFCAYVTSNLVHCIKCQQKILIEDHQKQLEEQLHLYSLDSQKCVIAIKGKKWISKSMVKNLQLRLVDEIDVEDISGGTLIHYTFQFLTHLAEAANGNLCTLSTDMLPNLEQLKIAINVLDDLNTDLKSEMNIVILDKPAPGFAICVDKTVIYFKK